MKKQIAVAVALMAAAIAAGPCYAQRTTLIGNIPFTFQVGDKTMPAGDYSIQRAFSGEARVQLIRRTDSSAAAAVAPATLVDVRDGRSDPVLVFHKYGNSYFLFQIWTGESMGLQLSKSKAEKELARESAGSEVAISLQSVSERGL